MMLQIERSENQGGRWPTRSQLFQLAFALLVIVGETVHPSDTLWLHWALLITAATTAARAVVGGLLRWNR